MTSKASCEPRNPPRKSHRGGLLPMALAGLGLLGIALLPAAGRAAEELIDGIAAQVGAEVVLISDVQRIARPIEARMRAAEVSPEEIADMQSEVLEQLIEGRLLDIVARRVEAEADDEEVDQAIEAIAAGSSLSLETLRQSVESQGLSFASYREKLRTEILRQKVMRGMVQPRVEIDEAEAQDLYEERFAQQPESGREFRVLHLLVQALDRKAWAVDFACEEAAALLARIRGGEDFLRVAVETTPTDPDLGWLYEGDSAPWMRDAVDQLEPGEISDVIRLEVGCAVIQLIERREVRPTSFEEAKPELQEELFQRAFQRESEKFFDELREQTHIERKGVFAAADRLRFAGPEEEEKPGETQAPLGGVSPLP